MEITHSKQAAYTLVQLSGRLDAGSAPEADSRLRGLVDGDACHMVLDLSGIEYLSSAGIRVLLSTAKRLQQAQGQLVLAAPQAPVRKIIEMAGLEKFLPLYDTTTAAAAHFAPPPAPTPAQSPPTPVSLAEEIYLLALDEEKGAIKRLPPAALRYALASALLTDLALHDRIDTDLDTLKVLDPSPSGDPLLDDTIKRLAAEAAPQTTAFWLDQLSQSAHAIEERVLERLIAKGILKLEQRQVMWVFETRRYPLQDDRELKEVRTRLRELIMGDEIPDPRDAVLISLADACGLIKDLLPPHDLAAARERIAALARLDLIGRETGRALREIECAILAAGIVY
ncbi:MAG: anti-sigma factor antagonist [Candidatus Marinimicrobia bacterium]|nr:anti-sigma factor antagonist [Candidatus Neomarinimicrobiota bacterium]